MKKKRIYRDVTSKEKMGKTIGYVELPQETVCPVTQKQLRETGLPKISIRDTGGPEISCSHCPKGRHYAADFKAAGLYERIIEESLKMKREYGEPEEEEEEEEIPEIPEIDTSYYELHRLFIENGNAIATWYQDKSQSSISTPGKHTHGSMMKNAVWKKYFNGVTQTLCPVCSTNPISFDNYSLGHIHPESKSGSNAITNLIPICPTCNTLMGTQHLYYYAWNVHKKILWPANTF